MRHLMIAAALLPVLAAAPALAQAWPSKPITVVVPYAAGGPTDTVARLTALGLSRQLNNHTVVVENATGAGGTIGANRVATAEPDGHTLLVHHVGISTAATLYRKLPYDTRTSFAPIALLTDSAMTIIARDDFPPNTLPELVAHLKKEGNKVSYGNAGIGAASHLCGMLMMSAMDVQLNTVGYRGNAPVMQDLLGKTLDMTCDQATNTTGQIKAKKVKAYAITTKQRLADLPDLPTADEAGLKGFEVNVWHALYAPKGTPEATVQKLAGAVRGLLKDAEIVKRFADINTTVASDARATPAALKAHLDAEIEKWAPLIKAAGQYAD
ncbi:tripartite tricarboxylate transporter substrate binding protein BugD [Ferrovibrio terrae]|uniref:Tripartite tricarboxylate transporter substrate binding protein BugD n=1 Tax=Ferrovibrio terrae TaxID=2594003 RepID=A0A516H0S3_9PROT|nr:tripartite tricarboxylate transporter substrate-binding protein [Ferrovibrio terrae]QDO97345.1 tripartite tricarboxylate transporter substrate binding protein BugD [Ferrovibrio terrae]